MPRQIASGLRERESGTKWRQMVSRRQWRRFFDHPVVEWAMFALGILLLIVAAIVGPLPGPGGVFFAVPGLILVLRSSMWARRYYVKFKRWQPKAGRWTDWALRRQSARRREALRKAEEQPPQVPQEGAGN